MIILTHNSNDEHLLQCQDFNKLKERVDLNSNKHLYLYYDNSKFIYLPNYIITRIINVNKYKKIQALEDNKNFYIFK